ncbi:MAG: fatty acid desaturase [Sandaracinaceae bacterium]
MSAITTPLTSLPFAQFRRSSTFYLWYDSFYAVLALCGSLVLIHSGFEGLLPRFEPWMLGLVPVAMYVMIMAHVFIHNASHGNFPRAINRIVGEICGVLVLTKFASWEIVHRRHHRYSDDPERDPHPAERGYWRYAINTLINVELQLRQEYYDNFGDTPETRRYERWRSRLSFVSGSLIVLFLFLLLGPGAFFMLYLPGFVAAALFVIHFNWSGHNAHRADQDIAPADLDYGWFWIGNRIFFGIYFHGTHHRLAKLFNPMKGARRLAKRRALADERGEPAEAEDEEAHATA